jgi:transposase
MQNNKSKIFFKDYSPNQILLLPLSLEEMIDPNHPVRVVNEVIDNLDIDPLIKKYQGGGCSSCPDHNTINRFRSDRLKGV